MLCIQVSERGGKIDVGSHCLFIRPCDTYCLIALFLLGPLTFIFRPTCTSFSHECIRPPLTAAPQVWDHYYDTAGLDSDRDSRGEPEKGGGFLPMAAAMPCHAQSHVVKLLRTEQDRDLCNHNLYGPGNWIQALKWITLTGRRCLPAPAHLRLSLLLRLILFAVCLCIVCLPCCSKRKPWGRIGSQHRCLTSASCRGWVQCPPLTGIWLRSAYLPEKCETRNEDESS